MTEESGKTVYRAPRPHDCEAYLCDDPVGSIWRCGTCGTYWKHHSIGLMNAPGWYVMGRLEVWWWKRRKRADERGSAAMSEISDSATDSECGPDAKPRTHDLTGTNYAYRPRDGGQRGHVDCWSGPMPRAGDYLILRNGSGSSRYRVIAVDPCWGVDPPTMWMADLVFDPRPGGTMGG